MQLIGVHSVACDLGKSASSPQQLVCRDCKPGFFANTTGLPDCLPCTPGRYQPLSQQTECRPCPPGTYSNQLQAQACTECGKPLLSCLSAGC